MARVIFEINIKEDALNIVDSVLCGRHGGYDFSKNVSPELARIIKNNPKKKAIQIIYNSNSPLSAIPRTKVRGFYAPRLERRVGDLTKCALHPRAEARSFRAFFHKKELKQITANSKHITKTGFPNYFGKQRFGGGNTHLVGREIIRGYFRDAVYHLLTYSEDLNKETRASREFARENFGKWNEILQQWPKFLSLEKAVLNH